MRLQLLDDGGALIEAVAVLARGRGECMVRLRAADGTPPEEPERAVVGPAIRRGDPRLERLLERGTPFVSAAGWLAGVLQGGWTMAVAGGPRAAAVAARLVWILDWSRMAPGFLLEDAPAGFEIPVRVGETPFFIVQPPPGASAYFDPRPMAALLRPRCVVLAEDGEPDGLLTHLPEGGLLVVPQSDRIQARMRAAGCRAPVATVGGPSATWSGEPAAGGFTVRVDGREVGRLRGDGADPALSLAAIAAARHAGVPAAVAIDALNERPAADV